MKQKLIVLVVLAISACCMKAYSQDIVYLRCTSMTSGSESKTAHGVYFSDLKDDYHNYPARFYYLKSASKDLFLIFNHFNYNLEQLSKIRPAKSSDSMVIKKVQIKSTDYQIDLDSLLQTKSAKEIENLFRNDLKEKKLYLVDKRENPNIDPVLKLETVVEVRLGRRLIAF